ncbi:phosphoserine aminotransferase 2, chloroplastic, partial [Tanacetum coccineum]
CYGIYMCGLVFEDLLAQGGLVEVEKKNVKKAKVLYDAIDASGGFYKCPVEKSVRSLMNVPFTLEKSDLEGEFVKQAAKEGMVQLKGHRSVGGMRASIYNAMPLAGVEKLDAFMKEFQQKHDYEGVSWSYNITMRDSLYSVEELYHLGARKSNVSNAKEINTC